jgi:hypothetical protein
MAEQPLGSNERHDIPPDLEDAIQDFLAAGRRYRDFLKRRYPDRLHGIVYAENEDGEAVLYAEGERSLAPLKAVLIPR